MSNIFISWSKAKSRDFAIEVKNLLESMNPQLSVFMSEENISAGERVQEKIINKIIECDKLLICFTRENKKSPWLLYEAGFASGLKKVVIPILFDNDPNWHSWIDNPMNIAREININGENFETTFFKSFNLCDSSYTRNALSSFLENIEAIKEKYRQIDIQCEDFVDLLISNNAFRVESPIYRNKTAYFLTGFETFDLWKAVVKSFLYTGKYLWIYGRKNMKLFGGNFKELFEYLEEKSVNKEMYGIDFRCLFLNPESDEVKYAHKQQDIFFQELDATIKRAKHQIGDNLVLQKCFRMYSNRREEVIIRLDNCIIYSKPHFDENGQPQIMTDTKFEVFSASSQRGQYCIEKYCAIWDSATNLF
jgi:nucleoside 2-deoxyribosyltransferase